jgi:chromosomal replication initiator protein
MALNNIATPGAGAGLRERAENAGISGVWRQVRARLREECGPALFSQEIAPLRVAETETGAIIVTAQSAFSREWVEDHHGARLRAFWAELDPVHREIFILAEGESATGVSTKERRESEGLARANGVAANGLAERPEPVVAEAAPAETEERSAGELRFTFDTFMVGPANELAAAAARSIVGAATPPFNPVFFYGDYGVGKTHLLHAAAAAAEANDRSRRALYLTAEEFLSGFVTAMKARDTISFKETVRNVDILLIDDVHFIAGKPKTEDEFLHTIAALIAENKQVVLASHRPPSELDVADPRLRSLMTGGLACQLNTPDLDLRRQILDCKIAQANCHYPDLDVPEAVRDFLAARITSSPRELEGVLNNVICRTALLGLPVSMETVTSSLRDLQLTCDRRVTVDDIQKSVATHFGVTPADICSKRRTQNVVRPRHVAMYLAKTMTTRSLPDIGRRFGGRDHSTVIHAVKKVTELIETGDPIAEDVDALIRTLKG